MQKMHLNGQDQWVMNCDNKIILFLETNFYLNYILNNLLVLGGVNFKTNK